ncbi:sorting nexin 2A-like [Dorcoceras hygrometricum]|uniref:Sorting nexin 2A-like n=1 Tax=Dorcoceras hygrometricum TaxID=472368 RepID=A0A2Z7C1N7_9LAMI|nr:sorting nexin 2A-like [Dorcoceras hygrometricum]
MAKGIDQLNLHSVQPGYLKILQMAARLTTPITACSRLKLLWAAQFVPQFHKIYLTDSQKGTAELTASNQLSPGFVNARQKVLTTRSKLKTTKDAYPEVHANRRKTRHRFLPKTFNAINSTLPNSALIQDLRWVEIERAKLGEFNATNIIKNRGWRRRESAMESYGEQ